MTEQYFIIDVADMTQDDWDEWGRNSTDQRYSIDQTKLLVDYPSTSPLSFQGIRDPLTSEDIATLLQTVEWKLVDPLANL